MLKRDVAVQPVENNFWDKVPLNACESCCLDSDCSPAALPVGLNEAECTHEGGSTHQHTLNENLGL